MIPTPIDWWRLSLNTAQMLSDAQMVMTYRTLGMMGLWSVTPSESRRMIEEKGPVFVKAALAAQKAAMNGERADRVAHAALEPIGRKTRSNARRLAKRGAS